MTTTDGMSSPITQSEYFPVGRSAFLEQAGQPGSVKVADEDVNQLDNLVSFDIDPLVGNVDAEVRSRFVGGQAQQSPSLWCSRVPGALLATPRAVVFTQDGRWLRDSVRNLGKLDRWLEVDSEERLRPPDCNRHVDEQAVLLMAGASTNYWHWLLEGLARVGVAAMTGLPLRELRFVVPGPLTTMHRETLRAAGIDDDQLIPWDGQPCTWKELIVPSRGLLSTHVLAKPAVGFLRQLGPEAQPLDGGDRRRLFIRRSETSHRRVVNEHELLAIAERHGFVGVFPDRWSFEEQIRRFRSAEAVIAAHGAGLTNCLFAPAQARVLELLGERTPLRIYWHLAAACQLRYAFCVGPLAGSTPAGGEAWSDFRIDPSRFERVLSDLLSPGPPSPGSA